MSESAEEFAARYHEDSVCPECREGKHRNCDGTAWSNFLDEAVGCWCAGNPESDHGSRKGLEQTERVLADLEASSSGSEPNNE